MNKIFTYQNEKEKIVELVRYFRYEKTNYFIYTLNEVDDKGYIKLYITKVMRALDKLVLISVRDDKEWATMKDMVRTIIVDLKDQVSNLFEDLSYVELQGITLPNARSFKLDKKLLQKLLIKTEDEEIIEDIDGIISIIEDNKIIIEAIDVLLNENTEDNFELPIDMTSEEKYKNVQNHLQEVDGVLNKKIVEIFN